MTASILLGAALACAALDYARFVRTMVRSEAPLPAPARPHRPAAAHVAEIDRGRARASWPVWSRDRMRGRP
jgi:hypothetical protein